MEDRELQELFDAKRTVDANRRRQEALRRTLEAKAAPKSRRLWPVWSLSAAAGIALLLLSTPALFHNETNTPLLVAKADTIKVVVEEPETTVSETPNPAKPQKAIKVRKSPETIQPLEPRETATEILAAIEEPVIAAEPAEEKAEAEQEETIDKAPRIHRRTSTRLANSGNIVNVKNEPSDFQNLLASVFPTEASTPYTLKSFEF